MKRIITLIALSMTCALCFAQAIPQLDKASGKRVTFHYVYSLSKDGADFRQVTVGNVTVEENAYKLSGLGLTIISDGETRWTQDVCAQELVIESVDKEAIEVNPALLIASYKKYRNDLKVMSGTEDSLDIVYNVGEDMYARFVLTDIRYLEPQGKSDLTFDVKSLPESYIVTDLR